MEARKIKRLGEAEYVLLLTMSGKAADQMEAAEAFLLKKAMKRLEKVLNTSLRVGDVAALYSDSQYIVLLPSCTYEAASMVAERIQNKFARELPKTTSNFNLKYSLEEVTTEQLNEK